MVEPAGFGVMHFLVGSTSFTAPIYLYHITFLPFRTRKICLCFSMVGIYSQCRGLVMFFSLKPAKLSLLKRPGFGKCIRFPWLMKLLQSEVSS
jgi:hypothetical protein